MSLTRHLNYLEIAHLSRVVVMAVEYRGDIDHDALEQSFALLCDACPALRARASGSGTEMLLTVDPEHRPNLVTLTCDTADTSKVLAKLGELPWDPTVSMAELVLVPGEHHGFLALRVDHAIADGGAWLGLFRELLSLLSEIADGGTPTRVPGDSLPTPPADIFHSRIGVIPYDRRLLYSVSPAEQVADDSPGVASGYIRLTEGETDWLRTSARRYGTSVHGLVCGAILAGQRAIGGGDEPAHMFCVSPVDFRDRLCPPVGDLETTNLMLSYLAEVEVSPHTSPVAIGQSIKTQLADAMSTMTGVRGTAAPTAGQLDHNLMFALVSNLGVVDPLPQPSGMSLVDLHIVNTVEDTLFPGYYVYTYGGTLRIVYVLTSRFFSPAIVESLTREIREQLLIAGASS